ncbi:MAG: hypothetical protein JW839_04955 [Candidatus Lokiarchaeota archaeon]|nr:hypothetical protein [Candidatus Lokiarchaeota archaeon]
MVFEEKAFPSSLSDHLGLFSQYQAKIRFRKLMGWDNFLYSFIIDTGASISYAPDFLLEVMNITPNLEMIVEGITNKEECKVITKVAQVGFVIIDDENYTSREIKAWFAFHPYNGPFLLGMKDVLERIGIEKKQGKRQMILDLP